MRIFEKIAEQRIKEAIEKGELSNLPLKGKPLRQEDFSGVSAHLRTGYKILKNANILPEEIQLKKEIISLKTLIDSCDDENESIKIKQRLNEKTLLYNIMIERNGKPLYQNYKAKIKKKLGI